MPTYSIIIPAYNESQRIAATLERIGAYAREQQWELDVVVVNDGSRDNTVEVVNRIAQSYPFIHVIENPGNRGKGYSVRNGMLHATGDVLLFTDADLSSPIEEANKLFDAIAAGADVAIGSRWLRAELQTQRQPLLRQIYGQLFNLALRMVLRLKFRDTQCGFKAFRGEPAHRVFPLQKIERWGFDPEILYLARKLGYRTVEVPVRWAHSAGTRLHPLRDGMRMVLDVFRIRWNAMNDKYKPQATSPSVVRSQ